MISVVLPEFGYSYISAIDEHFQNVANLVDLNGSSISGVQITVNANQQGNNWYGTMDLDGTINDFTIGGQELWLDDVCPDK